MTLAEGNSRVDDASLVLMAKRPPLAPYAEEAVIGIQTLKGHGKIDTDYAVVSREEIVEHANRHRQAQKIALRVVQAIEAGEDPEVYPGQWCQWCDAAPVCPQGRS